MRNNIQREDLDAVIEYLSQEDPILTQSTQVRAFESEWSKWLGVRYSVFVNSGSSANMLTLRALRPRVEMGEVIVPTLTWVSDIVAVLESGFDPVFVDINPRTLGMDEKQVLDKLNSKTRAVFLTHVLGYNALSHTLLKELRAHQVPLIEDVCESHGATFEGQKLGTFGLMSNFSFYYAHHLSTIEGGMICTDDKELYEDVRMLRSHGMVRESTCASRRERYQTEYSDLNPDFIFAFSGFNMRSTEIQAIIGRQQLKRLDENNQLRRRNLDVFLTHLDPERYFTDFETAGSCNYAFTLVLREPDESLCHRVMDVLRSSGVEFRRGTAGGGNQLRQPYLRQRIQRSSLKYFPQVDHVHFFGFYIGNYPNLDVDKIKDLCSILNRVAA
jgi:CDP-6-deoxy-D-xylo-4-hexulose-3-dehydrase